MTKLDFKFDENGLDMDIESDGSNLSVGQRQLVCFARILVKKRKLVILDEATANVDLTTEGNVQEMLLQGFKESTMFIIAHRLQTVMHCDRIMVLKFGRIIEFDSPRNLLKTEGGYFRELWERMNQNKV